MPAKSLRKFRQMEEILATRVVQAVEGFSAKVTHFMSVHSKVNCRKLQKYHRVYLVYVCK